VYALSVLDIKALVYIDEITELHAKIVPGNLVNLDAAFFDIIGAKAYENRVSPLLSPTILRLSIYKSRRIQDKRQHLTMMVSPRKSWRVSIVTGLRVATIASR